MFSCLSVLCRRRQVMRAGSITLFTLVTFAGCQGSLRSWRRDEPNVRDLVVTPHPLDERSARDNASRDSYVDRNRRTNNKAGRANPYAGNPATDDQRRFAPTDDVAEVGNEEELNFEVEDAALKSIIADADPRHRAMLVLQYQAMKNGRRAEDGETAEDPNATNEEAASQAAPGNERTIEDGRRSQTASKSSSRNQRTNRDEVAPASASLSDRDTQVRQASATRSVNTDPLGNRIDSRTNERGNTLGNGQVHFRMSDSGEEGEAVPPRVTAKASPVKPSSRLQEMKPPAKSRGEQRMFSEPMADTGYEEEIPNTQRPRGPREDTSTSSRKHSASQPMNYQSTQDGEYYTDQGQVVPAAAESPVVDQQTVIRPVTRTSPKNAGHANDSAVAYASYNASSGSSIETSSRSHMPEDAEQYEDWRTLAQRTLRSLDQEPVEDNATAQLNHQVTKRMLLLLLGHLDQALEPIPGLQPHEQEYFRHNLQAVYNSIDPRGNPVFARRWALVMEDHRTAGSHLGAVCNLEVKNAAFCSHVDGFGGVTKFPTYQFKPNQELLLYCEVENFVSEQNKDMYETRLRGNYEIFDANQNRVADVPLPEETDLCKRHRRDYFFVYRIHTPQNIAPGRYQMRLTIEDMKGNKFGQTSLDMQIVAQ